MPRLKKQGRGNFGLIRLGAGQGFARKHITQLFVNPVNHRLFFVLQLFLFIYFFDECH